MVNYSESTLPAIKLQVDQLFSSRVMKKYNWAFASEKRVKLQHREEHNEKGVTSANVVLSPQIHMHQIIQPLHLSILMQHLSFSQIPVYKQQLIVTPEEVEARKKNIYVSQSKRINTTNNQASYFIDNLSNMVQNNQHNNQLSISNEQINIDNHNQNHSVLRVNLQYSRQTNTPLTTNDQFENHSHDNQVNIENNINAQQLMHNTVIENRLKELHMYQQKLYASTSVLHQVSQFYKEDKLLNQLLQQNEQKTILFNIENEKIMVQQLNRAEQPTNILSLQTLIENNNRQDIHIAMETNQVKHATSIMQKPIQFIWHSRVTRDDTNNQQVQLSTTSYELPIVSTRANQLNNINLEHKQISNINVLRNLSNINNSHINETRLNETRVNEININESNISNPVINNSQINDSITTLAVEGKQVNINRIIQSKLVKPIKLTIQQRNLVRTPQLLKSVTLNQRNTLVNHQSLTSPSVMDHINNGHAQQQENKQSTVLNADITIQKRGRGRPRKNAQVEHRSQSELVVKELEHRSQSELVVKELEHKSQSELVVKEIEHRSQSEIVVKEIEHRLQSEVVVNEQQHLSQSEVVVNEQQHLSQSEVVVKEQHIDKQLTYKLSTDQESSQQHTHEDNIVKQVNHVVQSAQSPLTVQIIKMQERFAQQKQGIKLVLKKISSSQKFKPLNQTSEKGGEGKEIALIKATMKQSPTVVHKSTTISELGELKTLEVKHLAEPPRVEQVKVSRVENNLQKQQVIVLKKPLVAMTQQNIRIIKDNLIQRDFPLLVSKLESVVSEDLHTTNILAKQRRTQVESHAVHVHQHQLLRSSQIQNASQTNYMNSLHINNDRDVKLLEARETALIQRKQLVNELSSQGSSQSKGINRQTLHPHDNHVSLNVKQQQQLEQNYTQMDQLKKKVKQMEAQIEQQNESIKHSTQQINVKQLSNQVYEELMRRLKFEKQRLGR